MDGATSSLSVPTSEPHLLQQPQSQTFQLSRPAPPIPASHHRPRPPRRTSPTRQPASAARKTKWPATKPLVPLAEDHAADSTPQSAVATNKRTKRRRLGRDATELKLAASLDRGSAGREGRQFAVANVGHKGRIYLKPTVRPAKERYPQPVFAFPITAPVKESLDTAANPAQPGSLTANPGLDLLDTSWASTPPTPAPANKRDDHPFTGFAFSSQAAANTEPANIPMPPRPTLQRRPRSDSTVHDTDAGALRIIIHKPPDDKRPRTTEDVGASSAPPTLDIPIPSWRIGSPRFSQMGTPFFRSSSYAPSEEFRSSNLSLVNQSQSDMAFAPRRPFQLNSIPSPLSFAAAVAPPLSQRVPPPPLTGTWSHFLSPRFLKPPFQCFPFDWSGPSRHAVGSIS